MGKSGDRLRKEKGERIVHHFSQQGLADHDALVRNTCKERIMAQCRLEAEEEYKKREEELTKKIEEEWNKRAEEFRNPEAEDDFQVWMVHFLSLGSRILIEKFNWMPPKPNDKRYNIVRFINYFIDELNQIGKDELISMQYRSP